jgi:hypothetical protein
VYGRSCRIEIFGSSQNSVFLDLGLEDLARCLALPEEGHYSASERNLLSGIGAGEGGVGHGEVGWVGVCLDSKSR